MSIRLLISSPRDQLVGKSVIDIAVTRLIGTNSNDDIAQAGVRTEFPVVDRDSPGNCRSAS